MPQDVQLSLRSCAFKNPDAFGENPDGFGENPGAFCENSDAFCENPSAAVIYLPRDRWLCLLGAVPGVSGAARRDPGITKSAEYSGNCVRIQLQPRTGHTHGDPERGRGGWSSSTAAT